jgi:hypothetical protein
MTTFVQNAIDKPDQKYGRQLASIMERHALQLRATVGGTPLWQSNRAKELKPKRIDPKKLSVTMINAAGMRVERDADGATSIYDPKTDTYLEREEVLERIHAYVNRRA